MKMIIDTDAGIDDAHAILLALTNPHTDVVAITTLTGNVQVDLVNRNVCAVLTTAGQTVPVYAGAAQPLVERWVGAGHFHGADGMGDWDARPVCKPVLQDEHAANGLTRLAREQPGELTLVALGPLTNLALAARLDPTFPQNIGRLVIMGGAFNAVGNAPRVAAEFNIATDPEAAHIVLHSFPSCTLVGWEATMAHPLLWEQYDQIVDRQTPTASFLKGITQKATERRQRSGSGFLIPDPLAMAVALDPALILEAENRHVTVELGGTHARGQTIANYTGYDIGKPNTEIVRRIDMDGVFDLHHYL